jgi:methyl-accepting chemotaxis protein
MKTLPTLLATAIAVALILAPMTVSATGTIAFSSPTAGAAVKDGSYTIAGTVTPAPGQTDTVGITVKNPSSTVVDTEQTSADPTTGAFSLTAIAGGPLWTVSGTYTISASDSFSATGSTSFTYTAPTTKVYNVTAALVNIQNEIAVLQKDLKGNFSAISSTQATQGTTLQGIVSSLATLTTNLNTLSGNVNTLSGSVTSLQGSITSIASQVATINTGVTNLGSQVSTAATNAQNAVNAVNSTQTYVLVVAVLAAITLVLELAILVRKLS